MVCRTPQNGPNTCRHYHIRQKSIRISSDLRLEEGYDGKAWKHTDTLITKSDIMFSAWQHSDGHGLACVCMYIHTHREYVLVYRISPSNDDYGFIKRRNQGAKSVDRNAFDAACAFFGFFLSLFFFIRSWRTTHDNPSVLQKQT
jgi:hypothetical protein